MVAQPHLQDLLRRSREASARVEHLFETYTPAQLTWRPDPRAWSVVECVEHLVTTGHIYLPVLREALDRAPTVSGDPDPFRFTWFGKLFVTMAGPDAKRRLPAPRAFRPRLSEVPSEVAVQSRFQEIQSNIEALVEQADGRRLNGRKFTSPVSRLVRLTPGEGLTLLVWHTQRHVNQADRITRRPELPQ